MDRRLIEQALDEATRGCNCGMGVAECDRCREVVLVEALEEALARLDELTAQPPAIGLGEAFDARIAYYRSFLDYPQGPVQP